MRTSDDLEFVNRGDELDFLIRCVDRADERPALVIVRSPQGFGKSTLTDRLVAFATVEGRRSCVVDPSVRGRVGAVSLHNGFFLQRIAESLDRAAHSSVGAWPTLGAFLKMRRKKAIATKNPLDIISELPSLKHAYSIAFDYAARAFSFGRYAPAKLLVSDQADAVAICAAYTEHVVTSHVMLLVIREVQHMDLHSLRNLLLWTETHPGPDLVLEYTSDNGQFESEHHKLFMRAGESRRHFGILDLLRLGSNHLEYLIRSNVNANFNLTSDYYLSWDGNLRSVMELRFVVSVGRALADGPRIGQTLSNLSDSLDEHIATLSSSQRLLLAVISAHVEAIDLPTIARAMNRIGQRLSQSEIVRSLGQLESEHAFVAKTNGFFALRNDTIAEALTNAPSMPGLIALAEKALRDHYGEAMKGPLGPHGLSMLVRQYFRLCARTRDMQALVQCVARLSEDIRSSQDQAIYVDAVASAIEANPELFHGEYDDLVEWAAELAYSASDWARAVNLLSLQKKRTAYCEIMRACALQESGGHVEALEIVAQARGDTSNVQLLLATDLVEALVVGCRGEHRKTRVMLQAIITSERYRTSPLVGYAYRFFEIVDGFSNSLENLQASVAWFEAHNLPKSRAYSQLAAALLMARSGDIAGARAILDEASAILSQHVRDQHIVLNNFCAVELLSAQPDYQYCGRELGRALSFARDDFSELTILSNLSLALLGSGDLQAATDCADKCWAILSDHDFADTDIYWPVCFNMAAVYGASAAEEKRKDVLRVPFDVGRPREDDLAYWHYRYGLMGKPPETHLFLATKPWHPVYLSHWLIDLEGLSLLKTTPMQ